MCYSVIMEAVRWKFKEFLDAHRLSTSQVVDKTHGKLSRNGVYRLMGDELKGVRFESLAAVIPALSELTGKDVKIGDLLEYVGEEPPRKKTWRDLIGAFDDPDSPGDVAERHDDYLGEALLEEHERMHLRGKR